MGKLMCGPVPPPLVHVTSPIEPVALIREPSKSRHRAPDFEMETRKQKNPILKRQVNLLPWNGQEE